MERTIVFPERELHYQHEVKLVKNINIRIRPDMTVYVSSNPQIELSEVEKVLTEKKAYIFAVLDRYAEMKKYASHEREYVNGESFKSGVRRKKYCGYRWIVFVFNGQRR